MLNNLFTHVFQITCRLCSHVFQKRDFGRPSPGSTCRRGQLCSHPFASSMATTTAGSLAGAVANSTRPHCLTLVGLRWWGVQQICLSVSLTRTSDTFTPSTNSRIGSSRVLNRLDTSERSTTTPTLSGKALSFGSEFSAVEKRAITTVSSGRNVSDQVNAET